MQTTLDQLRRGDRGKVLAINTTQEQVYRKLMTLGFYPGSEVVVLQTFPAYLLEIGFTQIALDERTCHLISVNVDNLFRR